jgi:hypothetical protein
VHEFISAEICVIPDNSVDQHPQGKHAEPALLLAYPHHPSGTFPSFQLYFIFNSKLTLFNSFDAVGD